MTMTKRCPRCTQEKSLDDFAKNAARSDGRQPYCRVCKRSMDSANHQAHHEDQIERNRRNRDRARQFVLDYLAGHPCVDCGEADPIVLDFDHVDPTTKIRAIADLVQRAASDATLLAEIAKCVVRCANCHRRATAKQFGHYRYTRSMADI